MKVLREPPKPKSVFHTYQGYCPRCKAFLDYNTKDLRPNMFNGWLIRLYYLTCGYCFHEVMKSGFELWWDRYRPSPWNHRP